MSIKDFLGQQVRTPEQYAPEILRTELRSGNRQQYGIDEEFFLNKGYDIWNNWEVSFLLNDGKPVTGIAKILFQADAINLVESKSLKLYFNSFNMQKLGITEQEARFRFIELSEKDLTLASGKPARVIFFTTTEANHKFRKFDLLGAKDHTNIINLDTQSLAHEATLFNEAPELLITYDLTGLHFHQQETEFYGSLLRSNCKITHAPDTGDIYIRYEAGEPNLGITSKSLLAYILSFRKENHFHEECCEMIYKRLYDLLKPKRLLVACFYQRRGSLDINPIRYNDANTCAEWLYELDGYSSLGFDQVISKTIRQ